MEHNPLEQQKAKIDAVRTEMKGKLGHLFDEKDKLNERIETFILQLDEYEKVGLISNKEKEEIIKVVRESPSIQDRGVFISCLIEALEPLTILRATRPKAFEDIAREQTIRNSDSLKLSEVLYVGFGGNMAHIHLAPATELIKENGVGNFKREVENGLRKLAEIVKSHEEIEEIWATSWIVAKNPLLLRRLGFTIVGDISKEEKEKYFSSEERPVQKAIILRKDLLAKYGNPQKIE